MTFTEPLRATRLASVNPVAKLGASFAIALALLASIDWVSAAVALVAECALLACLRFPVRAALLRLSPIVVAAALAGATTLLYGRSSGRILLHWWLIEISDGSIGLAIATALRILAVGVPAVLLFITVDPTDLADSLAQVLHLPSRFVLGALAAFRLLGLFADDWRALGLARRARGIAGRGVVKRALGQAFTLFVLSIRRASSLATAMEARGFGSSAVRTWARPSRFGARDWIVVGVGVVVAALAVTVSVITGSWRFVIG
ncbi:energy-coupling factor transporter transmembrane component T [Humibacter antri]